MRSYRFYALDRLGRAVERHEHSCRDDEHALAVAKDMNGANDVEIWLGSRQVARIPRRSGVSDIAARSSNDDTADDVAPSEPLDKIGHG